MKLYKKSQKPTISRMEDRSANEEAKWRLSLMRPWDQGSEVYLHSIYSLVSVTLTPLNLIPIRVTAPM